MGSFREIPSTVRMADNPAYDGEKGGGGTAGFLSVGGDMSELNAHTYVYQPEKSLQGFTIEALPDADHYEPKQPPLPTLDELMVGKVEERVKEEDEVDTRKGKVIKFGWIEGVLMRCLLNIWGTMLFLRLTWVIGQCGIWQGLMVITACNIITGLSALSMSAISTNGQIAAGGVYYMISRALGPAIGGSIGIMFTVANTVSVGTYTIGFATSVSDLMQDAIPGFNGIVDKGCRQAGCRDNDIRIIGAPCLCFFLFIAFAGMDWVTRIQKGLLVLLILAQLDMLLGSFLDLEIGTLYVQKDRAGQISMLSQEQRHAYGYTSWSMETAEDNFNPSYRPSTFDSNPSFMGAFGVFFTAVTGIVAGANLSGDLKDPSYSIPKGTLLAIAGTYVTYMYFGLQTGFVFANQASGVKEEYLFFHNKSYLNSIECDPTADGCQPFNLPKWVDRSDEASALRDKYKKFFEGDLSQVEGNWTGYEGVYDNWDTEGTGNGKCTFGSGQNQMTMTYISFTGWLRYFGGFSASLSSAIASMVGAPRILQAVGKDGIYPGVKFFAKGYTANNDPWRGYILCFLGAMGCVLIAQLNTIGILASNFFLAAYGLMNLSCFHSSYTKSPGWRPSFKYYNQWVSLASAIACFVLMFVMEPIYGGVTVGIQLLLGSYVYFANPEANWGSASQAQTILTAMNATQEITDTPDHVKNYRPKLLVLSGNPAHRPSLMDFANIITKKISILIAGHVITEEGQVNMANLKDGMQRWLRDHNIKGYYSCTQTPDFVGGSKACMTLAGLGKLSPNMVLMGFKNNWKQDLVGLHQYMDVMYSAFDLRLSFAILRCKEGLDFSSQIASEQQIVREVSIKKGEEHDSDDEAPKAKGLAVVPEKKTRKISTAVYRGTDGNRLDNEVIASIQQFQAKERHGFIDVWWLYDDGGLTLLLPHILKTRKQFKHCKLRVFKLANHNDQIDMETRNMASMLSRFRIEYADVTAVPGVTQKASPSTKAEFDELINGTGIDEAELQREREKTNRHLRLAEMLRQYSKEAEMVVMTLPLPRKGQSPALYAAWLDVMTKDMPPSLLIRGNQETVLTFYS